MYDGSISWVLFHIRWYLQTHIVKNRILSDSLLGTKLYSKSLQKCKQPQDFGTSCFRYASRMLLLSFRLRVGYDSVALLLWSHFHNEDPSMLMVMQLRHCYDLGNGATLWCAFFPVNIKYEVQLIYGQRKWIDSSNSLFLKVLWIFKNIFKTLHDLNDIDEKTKMLKTPS